MTQPAALPLIPRAKLFGNPTRAQAQISPDGRWIAYESNESGRNEIHVRPFVPPASSAAASGVVSGAAATATSVQWQVSTEGGAVPSWRADGQALFYLGPRGEMMVAPITVRGTALDPGTPVVLFQTRVVGGGGDTAGLGRQYDVTRAGF